jgi:hypothetical protein
MAKRLLVEPKREQVDPDRVWLSIERKYNVAKYESLSVSLGASTAVEPGETIRSATRRAFEELREEFHDVVEVMRESEGV